MRKTTKQWKRIGIRAAAAALSLAIVVPMFNFLTMDADAATSLSGIENIKSKGAFSILEIVPKEGTGSIGYYVKDYEPAASWKQEIASYTDATSRKAYVDKLFADLKAVGLMGEAGASAEEYPMVENAPYQEYLPWDSNIPEQAVEVQLDHMEEKKVAGTFQESASGDYIQNNAYVFDTAGDYVENALYYVYGQRVGGADADQTYYYHVDYARVVLTEENVTNYIGIPLYVPVTDGEVPYYEYAGTLGPGSDFRVDIDINDGIGYFVGAVLPGHPVTEWECLEEITVTAETVPSLVGTTLYVAGEDSYTSFQVTAGFVPVAGTVYYKVKENAHSYYAVTDYKQPYRLAQGTEVGSFKQVIGYRYVGNGTLDTEVKYYTFNPGTTEQSIAYETIFVTGGYTNSDWFKRYVLDMEEERLPSYRVSVTSVTPDMLTEAMIRNAGMVVISAGFDRENGGSTVAYTMDTNAALLAELQTKPRVVDTRISGAPILLSGRDGVNAPSVTAANVYNFGVGTGEDARSALATNQFHKSFVTTTPYQVVEDELTYENFLRGEENLLDTDISMATCIRYIINTHRTQNKKTSLNVLDIQPLAKKYTSGASGWLTVATVKSWLPEQTRQLIGDNINITHMSTAELVCNIEDLSEQYDLIYVGAENVGNNLPSGMYYANIGDTESVDGHLEGLLDSNDDTARYSGNDLTPRKKAEMLEFANANMPIVVSSKLINNGTARDESRLSVTVTNSGNTLTASAVLTPIVAVDNIFYEWERRSASYNGDWSTVTTNTSVTATTGYYYRCKVTAMVGGIAYEAYSNTVQVNQGQGNKRFEIKTEGNYTDWTCNDPSQINYFNNKEIDFSTGTTNNYLEASIGTTRTIYIRSTSYQWYEVNQRDLGDDINRATNYRYNVGNNYDTYYYCEIKVTYSTSRYSSQRYTLTYTSPAYKLVTVGTTITTTETGTTVTIPGAVAGDNSLDPSKVDSSSMMYEVLKGVWDRENVMVQSALEASADNNKLDDNQDTLVKYLNLSRPSIDMQSAPRAYGGNVNNATNYDCDGDLTFKFTIKNPTDPTPLQTRYECNVYIDQNGDGRHSEEERIGDVYIGQIDGSNTGAVSNGTLMADTTYTLQRSLNRRQFSGLVAWKVEVVKVGDDTAHASEKGYAYIEPETPTVVDVLQIMHGNGQGINLSTSGTFTDLYNQLRNAKMYDVNVSTTNVNTLNNQSTAEGVFSVLDNYDMIILGFYDCYGELDAETAQAIVQYIDTGKAILFTHDTTSYWNWNNTEARSKNLVSSSNPHWGYYFNQIIRDRVGLDRYGVTNASFDDVVAKGTAGQVSEGMAEDLREAGYTVAYEPGSVVKHSAAATQGFTNPIIDKYSGDGDNKYTTTVSQTNKGQVTEYPFNLGDTLTISQTHAQYYQLNMNADDIVVWYCLSGSGGGGNGFMGGGNYNYDANYYNDGTNAYYIYNRGNITYSGAGHSTNLTADEAKLFVNTMVAAYRAAYSKPTIEFKTASDYPASMQLIPVEFSSATSSQSLSGEQNIYFKIQDTNLTASKKIAVELYYDVLAADGGVEDASLKVPGEGAGIPVVKKATHGTIYRVDNGAVVAADNLNSGILYRTTVPYEIMTYFASKQESETRIYLKALTTILGGSSNSTYTGSDDLVLKKLGLLRLE